MESMSEHYKITNPHVTQEDIDDHVGVGLVVKREDGKFITFWHEKYQFWTIPIGKGLITDFIPDIAKREAKEELGITLKEIKELGRFYKCYDRGNGIETNILTVIFEATDYDGQPHNMEPEKHPVMNWSTMDHLESTTTELSDATVFYSALQRVLNRECKQI